MCGRNLKDKARCVGIFSIVSCAISFILILFAPQYFIPFKIEGRTVFYVATGIFLLFLMAHIVLLIGIEKENIPMISTWWVFNFIFLVIWFCTLIMGLVKGNDVLGLAIESIGMVFYGYQINIVMSYSMSPELIRGKRNVDVELGQTVVFNVAEA